ncbi:MAG: hypothetical protein ACYDCO_01900 [Armatimonadota bacterium]
MITTLPSCDELISRAQDAYAEQCADEEAKRQAQRRQDEEKERGRKEKDRQEFSDYLRSKFGFEIAPDDEIIHFWKISGYSVTLPAFWLTDAVLLYGGIGRIEALWRCPQCKTASQNMGQVYGLTALGKLLANLPKHTCTPGDAAATDTVALISPADLHIYACKAWVDQQERREIAEFENAREERERMMAALQQHLRALHIDAMPTEPQITIDGLTFTVRQSLRYGSGPSLYLTETCQGCGGKIESVHVHTLADIGEWMEGGNRQAHTCGAPEKDALSPPPTTEERLLDAFRDFIGEMIPYHEL